MLLFFLVINIMHGLYSQTCKCQNVSPNLLHLLKEHYDLFDLFEDHVIQLF